MKRTFATSAAVHCGIRRGNCILCTREISMASQTKERAGGAVSRAADQAKSVAADAAGKIVASVDATREQAADLIDDAADTIAEEGKRAPETAGRYSRTAKDKLHETADYVRDHDAEDMQRDAFNFAR